MGRDWIIVDRTKGSPPHHKAWLKAHPHRSRTWLKERTADGFDIHHIDGDHDNNDPKNLILIEHLDHFMLHSGGRPRYVGRRYVGRRKKPNPFGKPAYEARATRQWPEVDEFLAKQGLKVSYGDSMHAAKRYALDNELLWPAPTTSIGNKGPSRAKKQKIVERAVAQSG